VVAIVLGFGPLMGGDSGGFVEKPAHLKSLVPDRP
jgi:hypothetical protein